MMPQLVSSFALTATTKSTINHNANLKQLSLCCWVGAHSGSPQTIHKNTGSAWVGLVITYTLNGINTDENGHNNNYLHNVGTVVPRLFKPWII